MDGVISIKVDDYNELYRDAVDGRRLKAFLRETCKHYHTLNHNEIVMICNLYGIEDGEDE